MAVPYFCRKDSLKKRKKKERTAAGRNVKETSCNRFVSALFADIVSFDACWGSQSQSLFRFERNFRKVAAAHQLVQYITDTYFCCRPRERLQFSFLRLRPILRSLLHKNSSILHSYTVWIQLFLPMEVKEVSISLGYPWDGIL